MITECWFAWNCQSTAAIEPLDRSFGAKIKSATHSPRSTFPRLGGFYKSSSSLSSVFSSCCWRSIIFHRFSIFVHHLDFHTSTSNPTGFRALAFSCMTKVRRVICAGIDGVVKDSLRRRPVSFYLPLPCAPDHSYVHFSNLQIHRTPRGL